MQHHIAQTVALVCHADARLRGAGGGPFLAGNSTAQFCEHIRFVAVRRRLLRPVIEEPVAPGPDEWMEGLRAAGARRVLLGRQSSSLRLGPDDMSVLGGGAGRFWVLVEDGAGARSAWVARWNVGDRDAADRRIWRVTYGRLRSPRSLRPSLEFAAARGRLERSLQAMLDYTLRCTRGGFRDVFEQALATLRTGERHGYHRDLAPEGALPEPALALLDACQTAWVFGGMGSWADLAVEKAHAREYRRVTAEHDEAVGDAIVAGANEGAG